MKILHLSTRDDNGGAFRAAHRLHDGLRRLGHDSSMLVLERFSADPDVERFAPAMDLWGRARRGLRRELIERDFRRYRATRPAHVELFSDDRTKYGPELYERLADCDAINLHWVSRFLDYGRFFNGVGQRKKVVWTLHDMNPFTGGCHYDQGCGRYAASCGACPQLGSHDENDLAARIWRRKAKALEPLDAGQLHVIADSHWLADEARRSTLLGRFPVETIHYGLDLEVFAPRDRTFARSVLGVPAGATVLLFAAAAVANRRKGLALLAEALATLKDDVPNLFLLCLGQQEEPVAGPVPTLQLGYVNNDRCLSLIYSAADLFVIPSVQEAFGLTALEAMACGIPAVGFAVGGIPDMIVPGVTGQLAEVGSVPALAVAIRGLLRDPGLRAEMSANCRRLVVERFSLEMQARRYAALYQSLLRPVGTNGDRSEPPGLSRRDSLTAGINPAAHQ